MGEREEGSGKVLKLGFELRTIVAQIIFLNVINCFRIYCQ